MPNNDVTLSIFEKQELSIYTIGSIVLISTNLSQIPGSDPCKPYRDPSFTILAVLHICTKLNYICIGMFNWSKLTDYKSNEYTCKHVRIVPNMRHDIQYFKFLSCENLRYALHCNHRSLCID